MIKESNNWRQWERNKFKLLLLATNSIELKKVWLFWHHFNHSGAEAFQGQRQQAAGVRIGNAASSASCATWCACAYMFMCNLAFWLHREPIGLQSGRRACAVGWTPGFGQANSKQEIRKSAEHRDNDMEIRDEITPTSGWLSCLLTDYHFLLDTCMPSMKRTLSNTTHRILTNPFKRTSRPSAHSNTLTSWCAPQSLPHCTLSQYQQLQIYTHCLKSNGRNQKKQANFLWHLTQTTSRMTSSASLKLFGRGWTASLK